MMTIEREWLNWNDILYVKKQTSKLFKKALYQ